MELKVITVDFWNTLFDSSKGHNRNAYRQRALITEIDKYGILIKKDRFDEATKASWDYFNKIWMEDKRTPPPRETINFFWKYLKLPNKKESIDKIEAEFSECILKFKPKILEGAKKTLSELSKKYKLGIVSDTGFSPGKVLKELMEQHGLTEFFSGYSFSDETGVAKPHEKAYLKILNKLRCKPENALHIGDIEFTDIAGAKRIGMKAIRFNGDPTSFLARDNETQTAADFEANSWREVKKIIDNNFNQDSV